MEVKDGKRRIVGKSGFLHNGDRPPCVKMDKENKLILYKDDEGKVNVNVRFADEDVWLTQQQLADIYCTTKQNVSQHIDNILADGELDENLTVKNFLTVRQEGKRQVQREILHNGVRPLCVIICLFALSIYTTRTVPFV